MSSCVLQALLCAQGKIKNLWDVLLALRIFFSSYYNLPFTAVITVSLDIAWAIYILIVYQKGFSKLFVISSSHKC